MGFNGAFSLPSLTIRNADGASACTVIDFGYNAAASTGNSTVMTADFTPGTVDLYANLVHIAQGAIGSSGACTGTLTLGAGTVNVGDFEIGYGNATAASGATGATTGTVNVNNNGSFLAGALVQVPTVLQLARTNGGSGTVTGTLNINGGTVQANTIVSGGGVSVINLNSFTPSSTLTISNTAGTLAAPISTLSLADAKLNIPALNGGAVVAVKTLTVGGSANTINISSVPPIASYPATFTLINYQSGYTAGTGPLSLGTLPPASPAYSGTLVDVGGGVIQLRLTAGPVAVLALRWTGATDNNWDLTTYDWNYQGNATNFFNGSAPLFDDTATQTNIVLTTALSPGSITVSNNTRQYTFTGSGNISGASTLTKKGTNVLIVANQGVDNIGNVVISSGTLQIGTNDLNGSISAVNITNNAALVVNRSGSLTLSSAIAGTGSLTKNGNGTLILSGANSYGGTTTLGGGTLEIDGTSSGAGALTTSPGTVLAGSGTNNGAITVGGQMNPGPVGGMGVFNANGGLILNSGSTLNFDLSAANPSISDSINVVGNLHVNNNTITVNFDGPPAGGSYPLFTYIGSLSGSFNPVVVGTHFTAVVDTNTPNIVYLDVTGGSGSDLSWASTSDPTWDQSTTNWLNLSTILPSVFNTGDTVLFDDTPGVVTGITVPSGVNVAPASITDNATNNYFTISGAGHINGSTGIVLSGPSTLAINTANTFSGTVDVQAGTLQTGNGAALGSTAGGTTVEAGATLDINGQNLGGEVITISSNGVGGAGALINNGAGQAQALRQVILASDATIGGTGLLGVNNSGGAASLSTGNQSFSLTKTGPNQLTFQNFTTFDGSLSNIYIQQGIIEFSGLTPGMGDPNGTNIVESGAELSFSADSVAWNKNFVFNGNGSATTVNNGTSATTELDGPVTLHGDCIFNVGGISLTITNTISGDGGVIKNGGSPLIFSGPTTYTDDTTLNAAALRLNGSADLSGSTNITINAGSTLTVTGMVNSTFILLNGHTLSGNGVVNGKLTANAGSTISPGVGAIGVLTVNNNIVLSGTNIMELDQDNGTNDMLKSGSTITYGGTLSLVDISSPLTNGSSFKIFSGTSYSGSFATITPATPGPGLAWNTNALTTTGTISVVATATPQPVHITNISVSGTTLNISATNGVHGGQYVLLGTTNVAKPLSQWTPIMTNNFNGSGNLNLSTNIINPAVPRQFYIISQ
jgi:autotransporter-associated beta strand protein